MRVKQVSRCGSILAVSATLFALLGLAAGSAMAQVATGELTGTVTDAKGAAMAGVSVVIHNQATGADTPATSNDSGIYRAPFLQPGIYDISASQTGFATVQNKGIAVQVGAIVRIDIQMPVASQQSLVTVTTEAPVLETEKTEQAQNVSENLVSNLPVSSRRWEQFVMLTPGVQPDGSSGLIAFHGINSLYNNNSVDGANNNSSYNGAARGGATSDGYVYSSDSIREFQVETSNYTAEVGQSAGGAVNAVTKSGTNAFHGDLFEYVRNPYFNAGDPVGKAQAARNNLVPPIPVHQQNQFGGSAGGPLLKDKLFFFATYDGYRKVFPNIVTTNQLNPSIANLTCPIGAPLTAGGTFTQAQCDAAKNYVLTQDIGSFPQYLRQDIELVKLDYQLNQSNHFNVVSNIRDWKNPKGGSGNATIGSQKSFLQDRFVIANFTTLISNNKVNEFRYQWGVDESFSPPANVGGAPFVSLGNLFSYGANNGSSHTVEYRNQFSDNLSITKGTHTLKMGVDINILRDLTRSSLFSPGMYNYGSAVTGSLTAAGFTAATAFNGNPGCGTNAGGGSADIIFCDWLLDFYGAQSIGDGRTGQHWTNFSEIGDSRGFPVGTTPIANGFALPDGRVAPTTYTDNFNMQDYAGYFQDTWKARPNLTINLGLRYDFEAFADPPYPNNYKPILSQFTDTFPADYGGIQPRAGIAYNFAKNTVLRVGGGVFVAKTSGSTFKTIVNGGDNPQINCTPATCGTLATGFVFPDVFLNEQDITLGAPFTSSTLGGANGNQPLSPQVLTPSNICPCGNRGIDPGDKRPRAYEAEVAIERQLPGNMSFSGSYVLTRGVHLPSTADANILNDGKTKSYDVVNATGVTQLVSTVPFFTQRVEPLVGPIITQYGGVSSWYHGMVLTLRKPMSHGVELLANYTLSRATDDGQGGANVGGETFFSTDGVVNPFNQKGEQGYSATDARNRFTASAVWQPDFAKNRSSRLARGLLNGWNLSTTITATNGTRYSGLVLSPASQSLAGVGTGLEGGMSGADIQTTANSIGGRVAWLPRDSFSLPNYSDVDFRLARTFTIHERYSFELRAEAFNLFNTSIIQSVNMNAFNYASPGSSATCAALSGNPPLVINPVTGHANTCMVPQSTFQTATVTSGNLLTSRQLQFGARFNF